MSRNVAQVYSDNPSTTLGNNDLVYGGKSPYGITSDSAIKYSDLFTQIQSTIGTQDINISNGKSIQSTIGNLDTFDFKAYDVDGAAYSTFMSLRSSNTPRLLIAAPTGGIVAMSNFGGTFTIDGATIRTVNSLASQLILQAWDVDGAVYKDFIILTAGNTPSCSISAPSGGSLSIDGAVLGGNSPISISQATSITSNIFIVNDNIDIKFGKPARFFNPLGTFYTEFKGGAVSGNLSYTWPTSDRVGAIVSNGSGTLSISNGVITSWVEVTGTTQTIAENTGYISNNASQVVFTIPATIAQGSRFAIVGKGAGGFKVAQSSSQTIHAPNGDTTTGTAGFIQTDNGLTNHQYTSVYFNCITANTDFVIESQSMALLIT